MPEAFRLLFHADASVPDHLQAWLPFLAAIIHEPRHSTICGRSPGWPRVRPSRMRIRSRRPRPHRQRVHRLQLLGMQSLHGSAPGRRAERPEAGRADALRRCRDSPAHCLCQRRQPAGRAGRRATEGNRASRRARSGPTTVGASVPRRGPDPRFGGAAGIVVGRVGLAFLIAVRPESVSRIEAARFEWSVLAFTAGIALAWGLLFSLAPARGLPDTASRGASARRPTLLARRTVSEYAPRSSRSRLR